MSGIKYRIKLIGQFIYYVLFSKSHFKSSLGKRLKMAFCGGFTIDQYYLFDFEHNDRHEYLSEYDWFRSRMLNKPHDHVLNDKLLASRILSDKIKVPEVYAAKIKDKIEDQDHCQRNEDYIISLIQDKKTVIIKPIFAGKGTDVFKIETNEQEEFYINGEVADYNRVNDIIRGNNNWMMCEYMCQHRYTERIFAGSVNTIRILVIRNENYDPEIVYAVHRFGSEKTGVVDNGSKGGLVAKVDLVSGNLSSGRSMFDLDEYEKHPDSGEYISGVQIPCWEKIKAEIIGVSRELSELKMIAWDVILTADERVCVIEGNASSGINILQLWEGQRNMEFGQFLKKNRVIR